MKIGVTGIGSWPGQDFAAAQRLLLGELGEAPDLAHLPQLPARGVGSDMIGQAVALLDDLGVDLRPAGWRVTDAPGIDHRRAKARWREDLDLLEEQAQGYVGHFKIAVTGPWTLAAMVERPRGDRMLADHGARRDLAGALAQGIASMVEEVHRRLPDLGLVLQLDEPLLPRIQAGQVRTASGFSRFRSVEVAELSGALTATLAAAQTAYPALDSALHCCATGLDIDMVYRAGFQSVSLPVNVIGDLDQIASGVEAGHGLWLGVAPTDGPDQPMRPDRLAKSALRFLRPLELGSAWDERLLLTPACGLAGWSPRPAVQLLRNLDEAAAIVSEELAR